MTERRNGAVVYSGPSAITGEPIVAITTGFIDPSTNPKTGPMLQVWILPRITGPVEAAKTGADRAVCGDCPLRTVINPDTGRQERKCYVNVFQAPRAVFTAWLAGQYRPAQGAAGASAHAGRAVRLGAWGDPAAVPFAVVARLVSKAASFTGYTHQWRTCDQRFKALIMASVDSADEQREASAAGWRTFRTAAPADAERLAGEINCPASDEAGHRTSCARCGLCNGARAWKGQPDPRRSIVIRAHGSGAAYFSRASLRQGAGGAA